MISNKISNTVIIILFCLKFKFCCKNFNILIMNIIEEFKITASSEVYVAARDLTDRNYLFQGTLSAGEEIVLEKTGPVEVVFTRADQIIISANGQTFHSPESGITGTSKIRLP